MARNKYPELTVTKILDVSSKLFAEKGYENVTIQDIVDELGGMTKGAIYHHFKGKEEIYEALVNRMMQTGNIFEKAKKMPKLTGLQKIQKVLSLSMTSDAQVEVNQIALPILDTPQFLKKQLYDTVGPQATYIEEFINEGNRDGSLNVQYPRQTAETFMLMIGIWLNPGIFAEPIDHITDKIHFLQMAFAQIGLPVLDEKTMKQLIEYYSGLLS